MNEKEFQAELQKMIDAINSLPEGPAKDNLKAQARQTDERQKRGQDMLNSMQDLLDTLRTSLKYIIFDLEATRRENTYLRKMLEEEQDNEEG